MRRTPATLALFLAPLLPAGAQYRIDQFTTSNGLPQNTVSALAQTRDGYLWIATYDGLARYDGVRFTLFDKANTHALKSTSFLSLLEDSRGTLWAGTVTGGLLRYDAGTFSSITQANGLLDDYVGRIQEAPGGLLLFYSDRVGAGQWLSGNRSAPADDASKSDYVGPTGTRWVRTADRVTETRAGTTASYDAIIGADDFGRFRLETSDGTLWVGSRGRGLFRLTRGTVRHFGVAEGLQGNARIKIAGRDREGHVWIHSDRDLLREDGERFTTVPLLADAVAIRSALVDREGAVWVGTNANGLLRLTPRFLSAFSYADSERTRSINGIIDDGDGLLVGSAPGVLRFDGSAFAKTVTTASVRSFYRDADGTLWMGGGNTFFALKGSRLTDYSKWIDSSSIDAIIRDRDGVLWAGTSGGLLRVDSARTQLFTETDGLPARAITSFLIDHDGRLLIGTTKGLARRDGERFVAVENGAIGEHVRALYEDAAGVLWIGTFDNGLRRWQNGKLTAYTTRTGLFSNGVFAILEDARGSFWLSSNRGISRVSRRDLNAVAEGHRARVIAVAYGPNDGMLTAECNGGFQPAGLRTSDGRLWFPTQEGIVSIDPERAYHDAPPPPAVVEAVRVDGKPIDLRRGIVVAAGERDIEIDFTAPSFQKAENVAFRYRLSGINREWVDAGTLRSVHYARLAPGAYSFEVSAANSEGRWNDTGTSIAFEVKPFFWQTRWFAALVVILALGTGTAGSYFRVRSLKAAERRLALLVDERTADLAAANRKLELLATSDGLTGLANRRRFNDFLDDEWRRGAREGAPLSLLMLDVDFFKRFNDAHGHQAGDECLRRVASVLAAAAGRPSDLAARYGGEEFALVLANTDVDGAATVAETVRQGVEALGIAHSRSDASSHVTVSIGVAAVNPSEEVAPAALITLADGALYRAKEAGRNRMAFADPFVLSP